MNTDILHTLEFNEIRKLLWEVAPSFLSKKRALSLKPETDAEIIVMLLNETEEAVSCILHEIDTPLGETYDITDYMKKVEKHIILLPKEFMEIAASLDTYKKNYYYFEGNRHFLYPHLAEKARQIILQETLCAKIHKIFDDRGEIKDSASIKLSRTRSDIVTIKNQIRKAFDKILHDNDQKNFFQENIITERNGRYVVPIKEQYRYRFHGIVHDRSASGQTLFMEPMISVTLNNDLAELYTEEKQEIREILSQLTKEVKESRDILRTNCHIVADIEYIFARGRLAISMQGVKAHHSENGVLNLKNARHPLIDKKRVVPISIQLGGEFKILIITGSNAGGKTIALKTAGLLALMNQSGLFIPADEGSELPLFHEIYAIIGDDQSIQNNLSTFSGYVTQLTKFLPYVEKNDLVLLDELGTGTSPLEGAALAEAITEFLNKKGILSIITSHFTEMKKMAYETPNIENAFVEFDIETLTPTYKLVIGGAGNSNAFSICRRLGISSEILERADVLQQRSPLHHMEEVMENLNNQIQEVEEQKLLLHNQVKETKEIKAKWEEETQNILVRKNEILEKSREEALEMKRDLRIQSEQIIKELKKKSSLLDQMLPSDYVEKIRSSVEDMKIPKIKNRRLPIGNRDLVVGNRVYVDTLDNEGEITAVAGNKVTVMCGAISVNVHKSHCFKGETKKLKPVKQRVRSVVSYSRFQHEAVSTSLNIIGKTVSEALPLVDKFLNDCFMAGISPVQIIHGKGTGMLRKGVHNHLKTLNFVSEFKMATVENGGAGVTEVYF